MRILILFRPTGPSFVARGWENVFRACGHTVRYWDRSAEPAFDVFRQFRPDLFVGTTWDADEALLKLCRMHPAMKVALYAATWGDLADGLDPVQYPIVKITDREKLLLERMKRETGKPDFVWLHLTTLWLEPVLGGYRSIGVLPAGITNAADLYTYANGEFRPEYECDAAFVGGSWHYKAKLLSPYLGPLLHPDHPAKLRVKIWGNQSAWSQHNYLGLLDEGEAKHVFRSARVCPSIGEPHSLIFSDVVERYYKTVVAGGLCVGGPEVGIDEEFGPGVIPCGKTPKEYQDLIVHYVHAGEDERRLVAARQQDAVLRNETYHDRVVQLFSLLGLWDQAEEAVRSKRSVLEAVLT